MVISVVSVGPTICMPATREQLPCLSKLTLQYVNSRGPYTTLLYPLWASWLCHVSKQCCNETAEVTTDSSTVFIIRNGDTISIASRPIQGTYAMDPVS